MNIEKTTSFDFTDLVKLIENSKKNVVSKVNEDLILLYYHIGEYLSNQNKEHSYGDGAVAIIAQSYHDLKGFNRRGLYRMRQFYDAYAQNPTVSPLVTQLSWTHHLLILSG